MGKWIDRWVTKKNVLLIALILVGIQALYVLSTYTPYFNSCYDILWCQYKIIDAVSALFPLSVPFVPVLLFSLITYKMRDEVFQAWMRYAAWWVPLTVFLTAVSSGVPGQNPGAVSDKGIIDLGMTLIFFVKYACNE